MPACHTMTGIVFIFKTPVSLSASPITVVSHHHHNGQKEIHWILFNGNHNSQSYWPYERLKRLRAHTFYTNIPFDMKTIILMVDAASLHINIRVCSGLSLECSNWDSNFVGQQLCFYRMNSRSYAISFWLVSLEPLNNPTSSRIKEDPSFVWQQPGEAGHHAHCLPAWLLCERLAKILQADGRTDGRSTASRTRSTSDDRSNSGPEQDGQIRIKRSWWTPHRTGSRSPAERLQSGCAFPETLRGIRRSKRLSAGFWSELVASGSVPANFGAKWQPPGFAFLVAGFAIRHASRPQLFSHRRRPVAIKSRATVVAILLSRACLLPIRGKAQMGGIRRDYRDTGELWMVTTVVATG